MRQPSQCRRTHPKAHEWPDHAGSTPGFSDLFRRFVFETTKQKLVTAGEIEIPVVVQVSLLAFVLVNDGTNPSGKLPVHAH